MISSLKLLGHIAVEATVLPKLPSQDAPKTTTPAHHKHATKTQATAPEPSSDEAMGAECATTAPSHPTKPPPANQHHRRLQSPQPVQPDQLLGPTIPCTETREITKNTTTSPPPPRPARTTPVERSKCPSNATKHKQKHTQSDSNDPHSSFQISKTMIFVQIFSVQ